MADTVLITGGAGFIGSHVARTLLARGYRVRVFDNVIEQVHGQRRADALGGPSLAREIDFRIGDIRDSAALADALEGVDSVIHLAAEVGVGQSMYAVDRYVSVNDLGTAILLQRLIERPVKRVVVASSMSIYGEGLYRTVDGAFVEDVGRSRLIRLGWNPLDEHGRPLVPVATPEWKRPALASVYALTKYAQERLTLTLASAYDIEGVALRLFNVFGPGQALSNPYTGVLAIFAARLLNRKPPVIFEDGQQRRDFIHVADVAEAFCLALEHPDAPGEVFNIGSGEDRTILEIARALAGAMGREAIEPTVTGKARAGDIRHCFADTSKAARILGFSAKRDFLAGLAELAEWVSCQQAEDRVDKAQRELETRGLVA